MKIRLAAYFKRNREIPSQAEDHLQRLAAYFDTRAHLAACESAFRCDPACTRPGCKNPDLQVPVNLIDLLGAARYRNTSVSALYQQHYAVGLLSDTRHEWLRKVSFKLNKPCPFLEQDLCSIYPVRPLPCVLFPEYLVNEGTFAAQAAQPHFRDYLCFRQPLTLSPERARAMVKLKSMWERENLISSFYLFKHGSCYIDFSNLSEALALQSQEQAEAPSEAGQERIIPNPVLERFFLDQMAECEPFSLIDKKIAHLNNPEGQAQLLRLWQDDRLIKKLRHSRDDRALVFRFSRGKLQAQRRSLTSPVYKYCG